MKKSPQPHGAFLFVILTLMDFKNILMQGLEEKAAQEQAGEAAEREAAQAQFDSVSQAVKETGAAIVEASKRTEVTNFPDSIKTPDADRVVKAVEHLEVALSPVAPDHSQIVKALSEVKQAITEQPGTEAVAVTNLDGLQKALDRNTDRLSEVLAAVKSIEVAPKVDVPAPVVNVPKTDLTPLKSAVNSVQSAVENIRFPSNAVHIDTDPLIQYVPADIDDGSDVQYFGYIERTGTFYIQRYDQSVSPKTIRFYFGNSDYATAWATRDSFTYGYWGQ
jgi:hypothetical protein